MARSHPLSQLPRRARWPLGPAGVSPAGPTEYEVLVATPSYLREALARFEQRYGMSSEEFLRRDAAGELDDREDFCEWYGLCYLAIRDRVMGPPPGWPGWPADGDDDEACSRHASKAPDSW